jgi:hypothetical protein
MLTCALDHAVGGGTGLDSPLYAVLPCDLRDLPALTTALEPHLDPTLPTLLLAECVFVYVPPQDVSNLLGWFSETFSHGTCVSYDPFGLDDSFGRVMVRNLAVSSTPLPSTGPKAFSLQSVGFLCRRAACRSPPPPRRRRSTRSPNASRQAGLPPRTRSRSPRSGQA